MAHDDLNQLPVILDGRLTGVLSQSEVVAYLQTREELQKPKGGDRAAWTMSAWPPRTPERRGCRSQQRSNLF
jgi:hypothetical protein